MKSALFIAKRSAVYWTENAYSSSISFQWTAERRYFVFSSA